jgi:hypothetical protein
MIYNEQTIASIIHEHEKIFSIIDHGVKELQKRANDIQKELANLYRIKMILHKKNKDKCPYECLNVKSKINKNER